MKFPPRFLCLLLALGTLVLYLPVSQHEFIVYDDPEYVAENRQVQGGLSWSGVRWAFTTLYFSNWHPLTWLSHMLDCELFGLAPGAHHVMNVLFHVANVVLLFILLHRWTGEAGPSVLVAALFAWHPLHVESVAWVSERKDVLSTFFWFLALLAYGEYARHGRRGRFWLAVVCMALGLMAKPMLVTLPCVLVLLDYWPFGRFAGGSSAISTAPQRRPLVALIGEKWPFFLLAAASSVVTVIAQSERAMLSLEQHALPLRVGNAAISYLQYVLKTVWPADLAVIYPLPERLPAGLLILAVLVLGMVTVLVWRNRRGWPFAWVGWLWFLGTLVPVIGVVQVGSQAMADRYTYVPLVGLFILLAWGGQRLLMRRQWLWRWRVAVSGAVLAACWILTFQQIGLWRDGASLFGHAVAVTRENGVAHINLSLSLDQAGRKEEAMTHIREAIRLLPARPQPYNNLGNLLRDLGRVEEAIAAYHEAIRLDPDAALPHLNLGVALAGLGHFEEAEEQYRIAARIVPDDPRPFGLLGKLHHQQGNSVEAVRDFQMALERDPSDPVNLIRLARILAADPNDAVRDGATALALAKRANAVTGGEVPMVLATLAMAHAELGQFFEAAELARVALQGASDAGDTNSAVVIRSHRSLFLSRQPYRDP